MCREEESKNEELDMVVEQGLESSDKNELDEEKKTETRKVFKLQFNIPDDVLYQRKSNDSAPPKDPLAAPTPMKQIPDEAA